MKWCRSTFESVPNAFVLRVVVDASRGRQPPGCFDEYTHQEKDVVNGSKIEGTKAMSTTILDPSKVGGVKAASEADKGKPQHIVGTMDERATERASVRRSALI